MAKQSIVFGLLLTSTTCMGQTVVSSQGDSYETTAGSVSFTIGEVVINTETDGTTDLTQGFHQTNWNFLGLDDHASDYEASIFPNPSTDALNIKVSDYENITYSMYDAAGRLVRSGELSSVLTEVNVQNLETGSYQLQLVDEKNNTLKNFKLLKNH